MNVKLVKNCTKIAYHAIQIENVHNIMKDAKTISFILYKQINVSKIVK